MAQMIKNSYAIPKTSINYSRSLFNYKRTHSTNMLTGYITPVGFIRCKPGDTPPSKFGFVLQSAPLLGPSFDNAYIDIIAVWCPDRLVLADHGQWLGDNDTYAWTLNTNRELPRLTSAYLGRDIDGNALSKAYYAEHYRAPHYGCRLFKSSGSINFADSSLENADGIFKKGIQVMPFRQYDIIYNKLFRNENVIDPVLFSKQFGTELSLDAQNYRYGMGKLFKANRLKNMFTTARLAPAIATVDVLQGIQAPVIPGARIPEAVYLRDGRMATNTTTFKYKTSSTMLPMPTDRDYSLIIDGGYLGAQDEGPLVSDNSNLVIDNYYAALSGLTVNSLYYSIMLQRYFNKASNGRRPVEFYDEFFGIKNSDVGHDDPQLLCQKRFKIDITRVVATANSTDAQSNVQGLGTQGAYSLTFGNGSLWPSFTATEYGMIHVFAVIRTQESFASGIDRYLSDSNLLSTYLPVFDHIGDQSIDIREFADFKNGASNIFGYQSAWYQDRQWINDVVGIVSPDAPLSYFTFARSWSNAYGGNFVVNEAFITQSPVEFDRMLQYPVFYGTPNDTGVDDEGEYFNSDRYQWIIQFAIVGDFARIMSKDSEQLLF